MYLPLFLHDLFVPGVPLFIMVCVQENPDLFKWLTGQLPSPDNLVANEAYVVSRRNKIKETWEASTGSQELEPMHFHVESVNLGRYLASRVHCVLLLC